jgi:hypothetical protein
MKQPIFLAGFLTWLLVIFIGNTSLWETRWECALVSFATFLIVPQGLGLLIPTFLERKNEQIFLYVSSVLLAVGYVAYGFYTNIGWFSLPYLGFTAWLFLREAIIFLEEKAFSSEKVVALFALGYLVTGALWASGFLFRVNPIGFDAVIVSLTAAHFHLAGFTLTVIIQQLLSFYTGFWQKILITTALTGMALVALGITLTKLQMGIAIEWIGSLLFALFALMVAFLQGRIAVIKGNIALLFSAICLFFGISLAILYAFRFVYPISWVTIPNMKVWHGTLNTVGFGFFGVWGWHKDKLFATLS